MFFVDEMENINNKAHLWHSKHANFSFSLVGSKSTVIQL